MLTIQNEGIKNFGTVMKPLYSNVIHNVKGRGLSIINVTSIKNDKENSIGLIYENQYSLVFRRGIAIGVNLVQSSKTYKIGKKIVQLFHFLTNPFKLNKSNLKHDKSEILNVS
jgi:hypothetical protein